MDEALAKSGDWPNVAMIPGTHTHAATGEHVEQPENTRIGRSRAADGPDDADCEHEPARVENGAQNGLECDTREKLEADIRAYRGKPSEVVNMIPVWLDRQAAITERHWMGICGANANANVELNKKLEKLQAKLEAYEKAAQGEFVVPLKDAMKFTTDPPGYVKAYIAELQAEVDELTAELESTCKTLRASVAGLKQTVDTQHRTINGLANDVAEKRLRIAKLQRENARLRGECD